jgi:hypothetical protein
MESKMVRVNTPRIAESRTEIVTKSSIKICPIAMMAAKIAVVINVCKIQIFFSSYLNGNKYTNPKASKGDNKSQSLHAIWMSTFNSSFWTS